MASAYQRLSAYQKRVFYENMERESWRQFQREINAESTPQLEARLKSLRESIAKTPKRWVHRLSGLTNTADCVANLIERRKRMEAAQ